MIQGTAIKNLPTPALLVDLDIMESNLQAMAAFFRDKPCKLRPHFKNTKCIALAKKTNGSRCDWHYNGDIG